MHIEDLANELFLQIFQSCNSVPDALNLAATCHHFRKVLSSSRLPILFKAAEAQIGPLSDAIQLYTHNTSQPAHIPRPSPPISQALLEGLLAVGGIANKWVAVYPTRKWRGPDSPSRRLLSSTECYRLRRALYRYWLYTLAFHDPLHPRTSRHSPPIIRFRAALLRPWPTHQLAEMLDLHDIFRDVLTFQICPSNGTVLRHHRARFPDDPAPALAHARLLSHQPQHEIHGSYMVRHQRLSSLEHSYRTTHVWGGSEIYHTSSRDTAEGWGDEIANYYVVEDMLKLNPEQLLFLYESITGFDGGKGVVESLVASLGENWFANNGQTLVETVDWVVGERGDCPVALKEGVQGRLEGIVRDEGR